MHCYSFAAFREKVSREFQTPVSHWDLGLTPFFGKLAINEYVPRNASVRRNMSTTVDSCF